MSRLGKKPISVPKGVESRLAEGVLTLKGPMGELCRSIHPKIEVVVGEGSILVRPREGSREGRALHGLFAVLVGNMVSGVSKGFQKTLEITGVGYKAELKGRMVVLNLGYSHPIDYYLPDGISAKIDKTKIVLEAADKELLGQTAAKIRSFRRPEPYKGKGVRYSDEKIIRKAGKAGGK